MLSRCGGKGCARAQGPEKSSSNSARARGGRTGSGKNRTGSGKGRTDNRKGHVGSAKGSAGGGKPAERVARPPRVFGTSRGDRKRAQRRKGLGRPTLGSGDVGTILAPGSFPPRPRPGVGEGSRRGYGPGRQAVAPRRPKRPQQQGWSARRGAESADRHDSPVHCTQKRPARDGVEAPE